MPVSCERRGTRVSLERAATRGGKGRTHSAELVPDLVRRRVGRLEDLEEALELLREDALALRAAVLQRVERAALEGRLDLLVGVDEGDGLDGLGRRGRGERLAIRVVGVVVLGVRARRRGGGRRVLCGAARGAAVVTSRRVLAGESVSVVLRLDERERRREGGARSASRALAKVGASSLARGGEGRTWWLYCSYGPGRSCT